jgi:hypothetical protein
MTVLREGGLEALAAEEQGSAASLPLPGGGSVEGLVMPGDAPEVARRVPEGPGGTELDAAIADAAVRLMERPLPAGYADDCSGYVAAAASLAGLELPPATKLLWEAAEASGAVHHDPLPSKGDLVFFDDTWDKDHDGRTDDPLTHVGMVVDVEDDGTVLVAHRSTSGGRTILRMNLLHPHDRYDDDGRRLNDYLRRAQRNDPAGTRYLSAELYRGFATPSRIRFEGSTHG